MPTTNDTSVFKVEYSLKDNDDGTITATSTVTEIGGDGSNITFENSYTATGSVQLKARKELTGKNFKANEFTFKLLDADGITVLDTKNAADDGEPVAGENNTYSAEVAFDQIDYDMEDLAIKDSNDNVTGYKDEETFTYYIVEEAGSATGHGLF